MTLPASGSITMAQVNTEMNISPSTTAITLNDAQVRNLAQKSSGAITLNDLHGKYQNWYSRNSYSSYSATGFIQTSDSNGNFYFLCRGDFFSDYVVVKFNAAMSVQWQKTFQASTGSDTGLMRSLTVDSSGNVYIVGGQTNGNGIVIMKLNSSGSKVWVKEYKITSYLTNGSEITVSGNGYVDSSGNFYCLFSSWGSTTSYTKSVGIFKVDSSGNYVSNFGLSTGTSTTVYAYVSKASIAADSTGANFYGSATYLSAPSTYQGLIWKTSSSGTLAWQKQLPTNTSEVSSSFVDSSGNYYGLLSSDVTGNTSISIVKIDSSGSLLWGRKLTSTYSISAGSVLSLPSGNICISYVTSDGSNWYLGFAVYSTSGVLQFKRTVYCSAKRILETFSTATVDAYNNVIQAASQDGSGGNQVTVWTKAPMVNNSNKFNSSTLDGVTYVFGDAATLTESAAGLTLSTPSFTSYAQPTVSSIANALTTGTGNLVTSIVGMT